MVKKNREKKIIAIEKEVKTNQNKLKDATTVTELLNVQEYVDRKLEDLKTDKPKNEES